MKLIDSGIALSEIDRYVVWDLETLRFSWEVPDRWDNPAGFGLSVAVTRDFSGCVQTWVEGAASDLIEYLSGFDRVVGFNTRHFDNKVLSEVSPHRAESDGGAHPLDRRVRWGSPSP